MDENEQNQAQAATAGSLAQPEDPEGQPKPMLQPYGSQPLADAPQQQADADARIVERDAFGLEPLKADLRDMLPTIYPASASFAARIAAAKFEHREQGHDETMKLLDEMYAAIERIEAERG